MIGVVSVFLDKRVEIENFKLLKDWIFCGSDPNPDEPEWAGHIDYFSGPPETRKHMVIRLKRLYGTKASKVLVTHIELK
jgi:hypothetical protein